MEKESVRRLNTSTFILTAKILYCTCTLVVFDSTSMFIDILIHVKIIVIHVLTFFKNQNLPVILKGHAINIAYTYNFIYSIRSIFFKFGHNTKHVTISFCWAISILLFCKANWNHKMLLNCVKLKIVKLSKTDKNKLFSDPFSQHLRITSALMAASELGTLAYVKLWDA